LKAEEPEKAFLQALIQIAAAFHHLQRGNLAGAASLLQAALWRLGPFPAVYGDIAVTSLRENIRGWLQEFDRQDTPPHLPFPQIL
jgi:predicted metal-dependent hydrolase